MTFGMETSVKAFKDLFQRYRRPGDLVFAITFFGLAVFLASKIGKEAQWISNKDWFAQPAFWPTVSIIGMMVFGGLYLLTSVVSPRLPGRLAEIGYWVRSLEFVAYFLIYNAVVPFLGYLPTTVLFTSFLTVRAGFHSIGAISAAILFGISVVVIFRTFLQVKIPSGYIYEFLPVSIRAFALTYL